MNIKAARREFYQKKTYFENKFSSEYLTKKFPEQIEHLLDEQIPKASLKQLSKFMEKRYKRIIKIYPEAQKALKSVITKKLGGLPEQIKEGQIRKFMQNMKWMYPQYEFIEQQPKKYCFGPKEDRYIEKHSFREYTIQDIQVKIPVNDYINVRIDVHKREQPGNGRYIVYHHHAHRGHMAVYARSYRQYVHIASADEVIKSAEYEFNSKSINFERSVIKLIEKFTEFMEMVQKIETPKNKDF